jgi:hypothetical protein
MRPLQQGVAEEAEDITVALVPLGQVAVEAPHIRIQLWLHQLRTLKDLNQETELHQ